MSKAKYHSKHRGKRRQRGARLRQQQGRTSAARHLKAVVLKRLHHARPVRVLATASEAFGVADPPITRTAYAGRRVKAVASDRVPVTKEELVQEGFQYVAWDGSTPTPLIDGHGTIFAVLAGRPQDPSWPSVVEDVTRLMEDARRECGMDGGDFEHRRGAYPVINTGVSYGGGQTHVTNLHNTPRVQRVAERLVRHPSVWRLANFGNGAFRSFAPRLHGYYERTLAALRREDKTLHPAFEKSAFAACTFNLGPKTVTYVHSDFMNLPWGWCAVTPLGHFNPQTGGHLVLWELRMVIEVPPGSTVLIPSAILRHSNTQIEEGETRLSFTQYSAGGLFRWVECGFCSRRAYDTTPGSVPLEQSGEARWREGLRMFSTVEEIRQHNAYERRIRREMRLPGCLSPATGLVAEASARVRRVSRTRGDASHCPRPASTRAPLSDPPSPSHRLVPSPPMPRAAQSLSPAEQELKIAHEKELRKARNSRHRAKLKKMREQADMEAAVGTVSRSANRRALGPLAIPLTPNTYLTSKLTSLNARLRAWGYCEERAMYMRQFAANLERARQTPESYEQWKQAQDEWMQEADCILDEVEGLLGEGALDSLGSQEGQAAWRNITAVVFKVQWIVVAVEVQLESTSAPPLQ